MMQDNLPLRGIPAALNSEGRHSDFSQAAQGWLRTLRAAPEPPHVSAMEREIHGRQSTEWLRGNLARQAADGARQADYQEAVIVLAQTADGRQEPARPSVGRDEQPRWARDWIARYSPLISMLVGAASLGDDLTASQTERSMLASLMPTAEGRLPFSTLELIEAMPKDWLPINTASGEVFHDDALSRELRRAYPSFKWAQGRQGISHRETLAPYLKRALRYGLALWRDVQAGEDDIPDNVRQLVKRLTA